MLTGRNGGRRDKDKGRFVFSETTPNAPSTRGRRDSPNIQQKMAVAMDKTIEKKQALKGRVKELEWAIKEIKKTIKKSVSPHAAIYRLSFLHWYLDTEIEGITDILDGKDDHGFELVTTNYNVDDKEVKEHVNEMIAASARIKKIIKESSSSHHALHELGMEHVHIQADIDGINFLINRTNYSYEGRAA